MRYGGCDIYQLGDTVAIGMLLPYSIAKHTPFQTGRAVPFSEGSAGARGGQAVFLYPIVSLGWPRASSSISRPPD